MKFNKFRNGFTLVEMTMAMLIGLVLMLAVGGVVSDSYGNWNDMYSRVFGVIPESVVKMQRDFNINCRKATLRNVYLSNDKQTLIVYQFSNRLTPSFWPDRYVQYYLDGTDFKVEYGELNFAQLTKKSVIRTETLCANVEYLSFAVQSLSVELCVTINDNGNRHTFAWAAVRHN